MEIGMAVSKKASIKYKAVRKRVKCPKCKGKKTRMTTVYKLKKKYAKKSKWGGNKGDMSKSRRDYSKRRK